jgi:hypothetical protein
MNDEAGAHDFSQWNRSGGAPSQVRQQWGGLNYPGLLASANALVPGAGSPSINAGDRLELQLIVIFLRRR